MARLEPALDLGAKRPVEVAAVGRELEEVALLDPLVELLRCEEVVLAPVLLALAGLAAWSRKPTARGPGTRRAACAISVPLPTPEGPVMTKTLDMFQSRSRPRKSSRSTGQPR